MAHSVVQPNTNGEAGRSLGQAALASRPGGAHERASRLVHPMRSFSCGPPGEEIKPAWRLRRGCGLLGWIPVTWGQRGGTNRRGLTRSGRIRARGTHSQQRGSLGRHGLGDPGC